MSFAVPLQAGFTVLCPPCVLPVLSICMLYLNTLIFFGASRDSVIGIATRYELDGPGIELRWGRDIPHLSGPALGPPTLLYSENRVFPGGVNRPCRGVDHLPPSSAKVKGRVELYLYSPSGPSWPVLG